MPGSGFYASQARNLPGPGKNETMNSTDTLSNRFKDCSFAQITELCKSLAAAGESPDLESLVEFAPHLEAEIRSKLPLIMLLDETLAENPINERTMPRVVAGCILKEEIGRGGMGMVFRGHQPALNRDVAIKIIRLNEAVSNQSKRFELERHALARLDHPNIVPAFSFTQDKDYAYLVMRLIEGQGLHMLLNGKGNYKLQVLFKLIQNDWINFAKMAADVASGLQHAHDKGLVHRDIKPGNLILDENGKIWIGDFGLAKMQDLGRAISQTGDVIGTPKYMAPEQIQGVCDPRSDIYSLGMTLYEIAAGKSARGDEWKPSQILSGSLPQVVPLQELNPAVPEKLAFVIMKACHFNPEERYQTAAELETVLRRFIGGREPDRRKKKRLPDAIYRKNFLRKAVLSIVGSILFFSAATYYFVKQQNAEGNEANPRVNFLDSLADEQDKDGSILKSVVQVAEQLQLSEKEKKQLIGEVRAIDEKIKAGEIRHEEIGRIIDKYHDSNLSTATKILRVVRIYQASGLRDSEKLLARERIHRFAYLASKNRLTRDESLRILNSLTDGKHLTAKQLYARKFPTNALRKWSSLVHFKTKHLIKPGEQVSIAGEISKLFPNQSQEKTPQEVVKEIKKYEKTNKLDENQKKLLEKFKANSNVPRR